LSAALFFGFFFELLFNVGKQVLLFFSLLGLYGFDPLFKTLLGVLEFTQFGFHAAAGLPPGDLFDFQVIDNEKPGAEGAGGDVNDSQFFEPITKAVSLFDRKCQGGAYLFNRGRSGLLMFQNSDRRCNQVSLGVIIS